MRAASHAAVLLGALLIGSGCGKPEPVEEARSDRAPVQARRAPDPCVDQAAYDRLKLLAFKEARDVRGGDAAMLDRLAPVAVARMAEPAAASRDDALNVIICKGRLVIDLPPGFNDAFSGDHQLAADVSYAVQAAADGSVRVYQLEGADPIVYRLAAIDLKAGTPLDQAMPAATASTAVAVAGPPAPMPTAAPRSAPAPERVGRPSPPPRPQLSARPSFNCRYARSRSERMVCSDDRLAALDRDMASIYRDAMDRADWETRAILQDTRDRFLARRERCAGPACVTAVYQDRIDQIDRIAAGE